MADINRDAISGPANPSLTETPSPKTTTGLSVSRRVKIGVVLFLMLCGYFLMEDRPRPTSFGAGSAGMPLSDETQMQAFIDDLEFVDEGELQEHSSDPNQPDQLILPSVASHAPVPLELPQHSRTMETDQHTFHSAHHQTMHHESIDSPDILPVVKFTGRIETIR